LAAGVWESSREQAGPATLAVVAGSIAELRELLSLALDKLPTLDPSARYHDPRGLYWSANAQLSGQVAFLYPGQGSQYPDMLAQLGVTFPEVRRCFDDAEGVLLGVAAPCRWAATSTRPSAFSPEQQQAHHQALQQPPVAQPALGAASLGMLTLLRKSRRRAARARRAQLRRVRRLDRRRRRSAPPSYTPSRTNGARSSLNCRKPPARPSWAGCWPSMPTPPPSSHT
jgi:acyl transferase domain-containing protein